MLPIQTVDLKGQYIRIKEEINLAMAEVMDNSAFIQGPQVKKFELELANNNKVAHCISCASGTDALQIAMMALNLQPGDEVIMPAFTYIATVETAALLGLKIILADVEPETFNICPESIKKALTSHTKLIVPVHLYGQCADMEKILQIAAYANIYVVEDTAQALSANYFLKSELKKAGTIGDIGITSFFPSKNLGCFGDGGALFTQDETLAKKVRMLANHGQKEKYYHEIIGLNSRLDTLQAAVLNVKLKYLDTYIQKRQEAASFYDLAFKDHPKIVTPYRDPSSSHVFNQYTLKLTNGSRDDLKKYLDTKGIPTMIYYPLPVHFQKAYQNLGYKKGDFPVSEKLCKTVLSLPMHTELDKEQLSYIAENILHFFK